MRGCVNWEFEDASVWSAPGQGSISTVPSCLLFSYIFAISSPAWPRVSLFLFRFLVTPSFPPPTFSHTDSFISLFSQSSSSLSAFPTLSPFLSVLPFAVSLSIQHLSDSHRCSPSLFQDEGNLRSPSADVKPCTAPLCTPLCWDADKMHCLATLPQACIFQINRCSFTQPHNSLSHTHKPPSSLQKFHRCTTSKRPSPAKFQHNRAPLCLAHL